MFSRVKNDKPCLLDRWLAFVLEHSRGLLVLTTCATAVLLFFTVKNFTIDNDLTGMIADDLPFKQIVKKYHETFPNLVDPLILVVNGNAPEQVKEVQNLLARELRMEPGLFSSVYTPGSDPFFEKNGLLYLGPEELEKQVDNISAMQGFLALLSRDFSLSGLFSVIGTILESEQATIAENEKLQQLFESLAHTISTVANGQTAPMSWQKLMQGNDPSSPARAFVVAQPVTDEQSISPAKHAINSIRALSTELNLQERYHADISITGKPAINYEDLRSVRTDISVASIASFMLVGITLSLGLGSVRLVFACLTTLVIGLVWTVGFAILVVGRLNMISVTFAVLFIGLGIDYAIQIALRYKELLSAGFSHREAVSNAVKRTANALLICAVSTAIGFYAFVPTAYVGASELGLISGTGMLIIFLASITVLPALIDLFPITNNRPLPFTIGGSTSKLLRHHSRLVLAAATLLTLAAIPLLPEFSFDANPLRLSDQRNEAVRTAMQLFEEPGTSPWTISVLAGKHEEAESLAVRLENLPEVAAAVTIDDFIPRNQESKLEQIEYLKLILPAPPEEVSGDAAGDHARNRETMRQLHAALKQRTASGNELASVDMLADAIGSFLKKTDNAEEEKILFTRLQKTLLPNLEKLLKRLHTLTAAEEIELEDLPGDLISRYISAAGTYRIQIFPEEDLRMLSNLRDFVTAVRSVAPQSTDQPVTILEAGKAIVSAFFYALVVALMLIIVFLRLVMRRWIEVGLVCIPLLLALCYTLAASVLFDIPLNFANIIVVPLLLGIGVDASLHVIYRVKEDGGKEKSFLRTSTSRGILFSSLTTILSFGTLSFMHHAGTASMGKLLTISVSLTICCALLVLPAFLHHYNPFRDR